jgi:hypothetical protein
LSGDTRRHCLLSFQAGLIRHPLYFRSSIIAPTGLTVATQMATLEAQWLACSASNVLSAHRYLLWYQVSRCSSGKPAHTAGDSNAPSECPWTQRRLHRRRWWEQSARCPNERCGCLGHLHATLITVCLEPSTPSARLLRPMPLISTILRTSQQKGQAAVVLHIISQLCGVLLILLDRHQHKMLDEAVVKIFKARSICGLH